MYLVFLPGFRNGPKCRTGEFLNDWEMDDLLVKIPFYKLFRSRSPETVLKRYDRRMCALYLESESLFKSKDGWTSNPKEREIRSIREWYEDLKGMRDDEIASLSCYVLNF